MRGNGKITMSISEHSKKKVRANKRWKQQEPGKEKYLAQRSENDGQKGNLRKLSKEEKKTAEEVKAGEETEKANLAKAYTNRKGQ